MYWTSERCHLCYHIADMPFKQTSSVAVAGAVIGAVLALFIITIFVTVLLTPRKKRPSYLDKVWVSVGWVWFQFGQPDCFNWKFVLGRALNVGVASAAVELPMSEYSKYEITCIAGKETKQLRATSGVTEFLLFSEVTLKELLIDWTGGQGRGSTLTDAPAC